MSKNYTPVSDGSAFVTASSLEPAISDLDYGVLNCYMTIVDAPFVAKDASDFILWHNPWIISYFDVNLNQVFVQIPIHTASFNIQLSHGKSLIAVLPNGAASAISTDSFNPTNLVWTSGVPGIGQYGLVTTNSLVIAPNNLILVTAGDATYDNIGGHAPAYFPLRSRWVTHNFFDGYYVFTEATNPPPATAATITISTGLLTTNFDFQLSATDTNGLHLMDSPNWAVGQSTSGITITYNRSYGVYNVPIILRYQIFLA